MDRSEYYKKYYEENREVINVKNRKRTKTKVYKQTKIAWRKKNKKKIAKQVKDYAEKNKEKLSKLKQESYKERKEYIWNYKLGHPCVDCGEPDPIVLEFDHINPNEKKATIANMLGR